MKEIEKFSKELRNQLRTLVISYKKKLPSYKGREHNSRVTTLIHLFITKKTLLSTIILAML